MKRALYLFLLLFFLLLSPPIVKSEETAESLSQKIAEYTQKLEVLGKAKNTLTTQINILNSQIELTLLKINQTETKIKQLESEIASLTIKIGELDQSLNHLSSIFIDQVSQNYKLAKRYSPLSIFSQDSLNGLLEQYKYISIVQKRSQDTLVQMETIKTNYDTQKNQKETKQQELQNEKKKFAGQKDSLAQQRQSKDKLLQVTKNDESTYQALLSQARSELEAIEAIIAGLGTETKVNEVTEGSKIATIISGKSCSSSGTHLHFMVRKNGAVQNPLGYLKPIEHQNYSNGDVFNPSGGWNWPVGGPVNFNQGYGRTWSIQNTWVGKIYQFHTGIDISGPNLDVYSTQKGTLYRGSYNIKSQKCVLKYVRVENKETGVDTLNLHVNYF